MISVSVGGTDARERAAIVKEIHLLLSSTRRTVSLFQTVDFVPEAFNPSLDVAILQTSTAVQRGS